MGDSTANYLAHHFEGDPADPLPAGTVLNGRFRILRAAGSGGMGYVYEAEDQKLGLRVALKCAKPGFSERLPPEVRAAREVSHFNVCKVHDLHVASTPLGEMEFLSMEFVEGQTLADRIHRDGPMAPREAREIARQICAGVAQAHRQGVIHGDLKPGNVIVVPADPSGVRVVVTDFGLARMNMRGAAAERMQPGRARSITWLRNYSWVRNRPSLPMFTPWEFCCMSCLRGSRPETPGARHTQVGRVARAWLRRGNDYRRTGDCRTPTGSARSRQFPRLGRA